MSLRDIILQFIDYNHMHGSIINFINAPVINKFDVLTVCELQTLRLIPTDFVCLEYINVTSTTTLLLKHDH